MNKWQTEEIRSWITCQAFSSEIKTKLISTSSWLVTTALLHLNSLAENPLLPPGVALPASACVYWEQGLGLACSTRSPTTGVYGFWQKIIEETAMYLHICVCAYWSQLFKASCWHDLKEKKKLWETRGNNCGCAVIVYKEQPVDRQFYLIWNHMQVY